MKNIIITLMCLLLTLGVNAQNVTKTTHRKAVKTDLVTRGSMNIRKPDYICISTDAGKDQLIMDGTKFIMTTQGRQHVTDSRKNAQFATFHNVLHAVINGLPIPTGQDISTTIQGNQMTITITPASTKKRQLFSSFVLVVDAKSSAIRSLRMNGRGDDYTIYRVL